MNQTQVATTDKEHSHNDNMKHDHKEFQLCNLEEPWFTFCPTCGVDVSIYSHEDHCPYANNSTRVSL